MADMIQHKLPLIVLPDHFAVCRLESGIAIPAWASSGDFLSITRTTDEVSIVCLEHLVPLGIRCEKDWRCLRVAGSLAFSLIGVLAALTTPLAGAGISVFAISTFDTDYLLVKENDLTRATETLRRHGHSIL